MVSYAGGIASAVVTAFFVAALAARRRRVLFEGELLIADLQRVRGRLAHSERRPKELRQRLGHKMHTAERYRRMLVDAEAFDQARELAWVVDEVDELLDELSERRELP